jgi:hypothetical protein
MKTIRFKKSPAEPFGEQFANHGFPCAGDTEDNHNHGALVCRRPPIFSTMKATITKSV